MKKVGIVYDTREAGKGHHGTHLAFTGLPGVERILADPNREDLGRRLEEIGASRHYVDYRDMLASERPDFVTVCSRLPGDHFEVVMAAMTQGCHVLCEKPLTASLEEADAMAAFARERGVKVAVAHLARHALVFRSMKRMIDEGAIGRPLTFYGRGKEDGRGGGEDLMVLGTHVLDLGVFLFGRPESVYAEVRAGGRPISASDRCATEEDVGPCAGDAIWANVRFPHGVNGIFESRRGLSRDAVRMGITVVGTEGSLSVRYDQQRALRMSRSALPPEDEARYEALALTEDRTLPEGIEVIDYTGYRPQPADYFADCNRFAALDVMGAIAEDRPPCCSIADAVTTLEMIYGIYASSLQRRAIPFPLVDRRHPLEVADHAA